MRTRLIALIAAIALAVVGGVLLVLYVRGVQSEAAAGAAPTPVYVVTAPVAPGTPASRLGTSVELREVPGAYVVDGAVDDLAELAGMVATAALIPGEQLVEGRFATPDDFAAEGGTVEVPEGMQEVSLAVPAARIVGGRVSAGSHVGVWVSSGSGSAATTTLLIEQALVTATGTAGSSAPTAGSTGDLTVTLALSGDDTARLIHSAEFGSLWFSLQFDDTLPPQSATTTGATP